jgi:hypothetical protein
MLKTPPILAIYMEEVKYFLVKLINNKTYTIFMDELEKIKKRLKKDFDELIEVDEDSDIPVSEKKVKDEKIREIKE